MFQKPFLLTIFLLIIVGALNSVSVRAQERIRAGQTINGATEASDHFDSGFVHDYYLYEGLEGEKIKITLTKKSDNFHGFYTVGIFQLSPRVFYEVPSVRPQQDGTITFPTDGIWGISVNSLKTSIGAYTLLVEQIILPTTPPKQYPEIRAGEIRVGSLNDKSRRDNSRLFEQWAYKGRKGERIRVMTYTSVGSHVATTLNKRSASIISNDVLTKRLPFVPTTDEYFHKSSSFFVIPIISTEVRDAVFDEDTTYLITTSSDGFKDYKVRVESFGVFDSAAHLPVSEGMWAQVSSNNDTIVSIDRVQTKVIAGDGSYKLYRARVRFDYKNAKDLGGAKFDRAVFAIEVACGQRQLSVLSILAYSGDKLIAGNWHLDDWAGFSQQQFGGTVLDYICQQK